MPRYFFNIFDGRGLADENGEELPDPSAAQVFAIHFAGEVLQADADCIRPEAPWRLEVTDEAGCIILCLDFSVTPSPALAGRYNRSYRRAFSDPDAK